LFLQKPKRHRQKTLQSQFNFFCNCEACANDFPLAKDLNEFDENFIDPSEEFSSLDDALRIFKENCEYIDEHADKFPSFELCRLMQVNFNILHLIAGNNFSVDVSNE
jgi:hypothetical protein